MQNRSALPMIGALLLFTVLPLRAQNPTSTATQNDKTYSLEAKYAVGDLLKYKTSMKTQMTIKTDKGDSPIPNMDGDTTMVTRTKTAGIKPDGTAVLVTTTESSKMTMNGNTVPINDVPTITMEVNKYGIGKVRGLENAPGMADIGSFMNMNQMPSQGVVLPDHPVKVGDTWENEIPFIGDQKAKVVSTLLGVEQIGGQETLKVKQVMTVPLNMSMDSSRKITHDAANAVMTMSGTMTMNGIINILPTNARLIKSVGDGGAQVDMELKGAAAEQSPVGTHITMTVKMNMSMDLLSAGKVEAQPTKPAGSGHAKTTESGKGRS